MSSPITGKKRSLIDSFLIRLHQRLSHSNRIKILSDLISDELNQHFDNSSQIKCLDIGCGDMTVSEGISLTSKHTLFTCIDIHKLPDELKDTLKWKKYKQFDGTNIPFENNAFDYSLFCDVLHHIPGDLSPLIKEASRVSPLIIIKDHFEYGFFSRLILKLMDLVGNRAYGITVPDKYFTEKSFEDFYEENNLELVRLKKNIDLYGHLPVIRLFLVPSLQFIAVLKRR